MGKTLAEQLIGSHTESGVADAGEIVEVAVDMLMTHEVLGSRIMPILEEMDVKRVWDPARILVVNDHWAPASDTKSAEIHQRNRQFVREHKIKHFCDVDCGICHQVLPELGLVAPGDLIIGSDSHSTLYGAFNAFATGLAATDCAIIIATGKTWLRVPESIKITVSGEFKEYVMSKDLILKIIADLGADGANYMSMEFHGPTIDQMSVDSRMTMTNMSVEAGAKSGLMTVNKSVQEWMNKRPPDRKWAPVVPDNTAEYQESLEYDLDKEALEPYVAVPDSPANGRPVTEVVGTPIDQAFLGSCTNGRLEDLQVAAKILKGRHVHNGTRMIVTPASREVYMSALDNGIIRILMEAGAVVTNATCGACVGGHLGVLGAGEVCISSTNRNFPGRMGHRESKVYLASPATVTASAIMGEITDPRSV
ncbi:MAG: 3-isopropylmalate dehydratase large subunit [Candidatus Thorarchaeota archaeon]|nr:3-isopropylmalate dehydratase large subunit [Candidatus Thorarchaeota archaeon]